MGTESAQSIPQPSSSLDKTIPSLLLRTKRKSISTTIEPAPATPVLPPPSINQDRNYETPVRRIITPNDHTIFLESSTYDLIKAWMFTLSDCVHGLSTLSISQSTGSPTLTRIDLVLDMIEALTKQYPAFDTGSRFGNPAFRDFHNALVNTAQRLHYDILQVSDDRAVSEVSVYLNNAFGSAERLDYGSGHELNFLMWLLCLYQLGYFEREDFPILVLRIFPHYLQIIRQIQSTYYLEPAGSHGVWGLDDYQFLPFLFGASQLINHRYITPRAVHNNVVLDEEGNKYLYLNQVRWVDSVKTVKGLRWHSPMLDDISSAKSWRKIEDGMKKMFVKEVLGKLPIMQHFLFGSLIPAATSMGRRSAEDEAAQAERMRHLQENGHEPDYWGDCCGIKVPSTVAAGEEMRKRMGTNGGLRLIPFD